MKTIVSFVFIILLSLSSAGYNPGPALEKADSMESGHLSLDSCSLDLGVIPPDTIAEGVMRFRNTGNAPLQILSIFSDCGCTTTSYTADPVEPGEEGEIRISFNPKGRRPGPFRKTLRIRSNAGNTRVTLSVKGRVDDAKMGMNDKN